MTRLSFEDRYIDRIQLSNTLSVTDSSESHHLTVADHEVCLNAARPGSGSTHRHRTRETPFAQPVYHTDRTTILAWDRQRTMATRMNCEPPVGCAAAMGCRLGHASFRKFDRSYSMGGRPHARWGWGRSLDRRVGPGARLEPRTRPRDAPPRSDRLLL